MPFPELNEVPKKTARSSHWARRWLREIFVEDLGLKLLALAISLALWYGVTGQRTPTTIRVPHVPLNFRLPNNTEISNDPRSEVEVALTGNKSALDAINVRDLIVNVDVSDLKPGSDPYNVQLTPERVTMGLPDGVRFSDIQQNNVLLRIEPRTERELEVDVPEKVKVRGPASRINLLQKAPTEMISLEGRKESFTLPQVTVEIGDKKVDLIDTFVSVRVEIEEQSIVKTFTNVSVQASPGTQASQRTVTVTLSGPLSLLNKLSATDIQIALELGADGSIKPRLIVPANMEGRIELRSYK